MFVTQKQKQIAELVVEGLTTPQIAERLGNTEGTIEQHLVKLFKRLSISSRKDLARYNTRLVVIDRRFKEHQDAPAITPRRN